MTSRLRSACVRQLLALSLRQRRPASPARLLPPVPTSRATCRRRTLLFSHSDTSKRTHTHSLPESHVKPDSQAPHTITSDLRFRQSASVTLLKTDPDTRLRRQDRTPAQSVPQESHSDLISYAPLTSQSAFQSTNDLPMNLPLLASPVIQPSRLQATHHACKKDLLLVSTDLLRVYV